MNPTVQNLKTFLFLTGNAIFPLPENYRAVSVYHTSASNNYQQSHDFLKQEKINQIALYELTDLLDVPELFKINSLSIQFRELVEQSEGVIFFGGPDIQPSIYGQATNLLTVITNPQRHNHELSFLFHLLGGYQDESFTPFLEERPDYRILGICLGMQSMNVAIGGTMYQDIPTQLYGISTVEEVLALPADRQHRNYCTNFSLDNELPAGSFHRIRIKPASIMENIAGGSAMTPNIVTSHHQAIKDLGMGWKITATCMDEIIVEAIEHTSYPNVFGIQFHPEVPRLFNGEKLKLKPGETTGLTFPEMLPGSEGYDFHRDFWKYLGEIYN